MLLLLQTLALSTGSAVGISAGSSTVSGVGLAFAASGVGSAAGTSQAEGIGQALAESAVGSASGGSIVIGIAGGTFTGVGSSSGTSTVLGISIPTLPAGTGTNAIRWLRRAPGINDEQRRTRHTAAQLAMETGIGDSTTLDPQVLLRWSNDGGHTWSNLHPTSMGAQGQYTKRAIWRRLGQGRNRVYEVSGSDPVKVAILDLYLAAEGERRG